MNAVALAYTNPNGAALNPNRTWSAPTPELIEHLPLGVGIEDTDGLLLECNQAFADYYSMAAQDLVGISFMERMELVCPNVIEVNGQAVPDDGPMASFSCFQTMRCDARGAIQTTLRDGRSFRHERKSLTDGRRLVVVTELTALQRLEAELRAIRARSVQTVGELKANINGSNHPSQQEPSTEESCVSLGSCRLNMEAARLFAGDGTEIPITAMEFSLLRVFVENRGRILNRDQLLADAHSRGWEHFDRSIDLRISRIRKKIEINPAKPQIIRTVRGLGYILD